MEAILQAKEISKTYHTGSVDVPALKQCSLEFGKGEFTAIIGKSGSGKSTLLRILGYTRYRQYINKRRGHNTYEGQEAVRFQKKKYRLYISGLQPVSRIYII